MKSKRTKACEIPPEVKAKVEKRDKGACIFCGAPYPYARGEAHYIGRAHGGLGIEENLITTCRRCHHELDNGKNREYFRKTARAYLQAHYKDWSEEKLIYKKYSDYNK